MPRVVFTANLQRHVSCPEQDADGTTVREVLDSVFAGNPKLRGYIVDDQDRLRTHVLIFVDGRMIGDRTALSDHVSKTSAIHVMQALSGG